MNSTVATLVAWSATAAQSASVQNPSPMVETTRAHERLAPVGLNGTTRSISGVLDRPMELFIPTNARSRAEMDVVIHFHGAAWLPQLAAARLPDPAVVIVVNLGAGSGAYHRPFTDPAMFDSLVSRITSEVGAATRLRRLVLTGFSAGHGAIRQILREPRHVARVDAVLLLDGMHTSYVPEGKVLADSGVLDTTNLTAFREFARAAIRGEKRFIVTHSEIFPGTFASTTETADWLITALGLHRSPVLKWGPRGMQQLSQVRAGGFELMGFAGNSAPDHVDHLHALPELLAVTLRR